MPCIWHFFKNRNYRWLRPFTYDSINTHPSTLMKVTWGYVYFAQPLLRDRDVIPTRKSESTRKNGLKTMIFSWIFCTICWYILKFHTISENSKGSIMYILPKSSGYITKVFGKETWASKLRHLVMSPCSLVTY